MNKKELARFRKLINAERDRVRRNLGIIEEEISDQTSNKASGNQGYSNHMADIGSDAMYLKQLDAALKRIDDGTYGVCEECNDKIPLKRLEAYLAAELCIACKSKQEKLQRS
jgi:DnaK suppressor protein